LFTIGNPGNVGRSRPDKIVWAATEMFGEVFLKARQYAHGGGGCVSGQKKYKLKKNLLSGYKKSQNVFSFWYINP
jgi:hypothetical protein